MVRFGNEKIKTHHWRNRIMLLLFVLLICVFLWAVSAMGASNVSRERENLEQAINRCIVQCYALEGTYPPSLSYMKEHYGLTYDEDLFYVDYTSIGSNLWPDVTILLIGE